MAEKGFVQATLAEKIGVHQTFVGKLVQGKRSSVGADVLYRLCAALGVPTDHFKPFLAPDTVDAAAEPEEPAAPPAKPKGKGKK